MNGLVFLSVALVVSVLGSMVLWLMHRDPTSVDSGIDEFQREMQALRPHRRDDEPSTRRRRGRR